jgi:hypothetical protein
MSRSRELLTSVCLVLAAGVLPPTACEAQARYTAGGVRVEILGLERWTRRMLEDSVAKYVPGQTLHDAACQIVLRRDLKFPETLVHEVHMYGAASAGGWPRFVSIRVVEPRSRHRVRWRRVPADSFETLLPDYASLVLPVTDSSGNIWMNRLLAGSRGGMGAVPQGVAGGGDTTAQPTLDPVARFLAAHRSETDRQRAVTRLGRSGFYVNRLAAAFVLSNFPETDSTWHALVRALRDPNEAVRHASGVVLMRLPRRPVDWTPVHDDLRALLGGTNLSVMDDLLRLLAQTRVSPTLASAVLRGNDAWVLRLLESEAPNTATAARAFLTAMNGGQDLGASPRVWRTWIGSR